MSSMVNDLFLKVIEIQQKTLEKIDTKADAEQTAIAFCAQTAEQPTGTTVTFKNDKSIYKIVVSAQTTYTLDTSELSLEQSSYVFEIWVYMANAYSITFSGVTWLEQPDLTLVDQSPTLFCLTFRTVPTKFGSVTISSPSIIGNLAYKHAVTVS